MATYQGRGPNSFSIKSSGGLRASTPPPQTQTENFNCETDTQHSRLFQAVTFLAAMANQRLDKLAAYFNEKERSRLAEIAQASTGGLPEMSVEEIRLSCRENDGYDSPELNEKLYLHFRGFKKIENLESYVSVKAIWLDSNGFQKMEGLSSLLNLRCLYLGKNLISKIEGLEGLHNLTTLDLSNNRLTAIENLSCCSSLQIVNFSRNALQSVESIRHLIECSSIENVDLSNNGLEGDVVREVFQYMPRLVALTLGGNPATQMQSFRKVAITSIPKLAYLDRPVDEIERIGAEAFVLGGAEAEKAAKEEYRERQKQSRANEMTAFREWQKSELDRRKGSEEIGKRCYVSDFTEEEIAQREAEAHKAAEDEKRMVALGIGKIGARYWQLQGQGDSSHGDGLQRAVDSLLEEEAAREKAGVVVDESLPPPVSDLDAETLPPLPPPLSMGAGEPSPILEEKSVVEDETSVVEVPPVSEVSAEAGTDEDLPESDEESQEVRDQRVAESVRIYLHQQEQLREQKERQAKGLSQETPGPLSLSTWDPLRGTASALVGIHRHVYWTEWMDLKLAEFVRGCFFDFAQVASSFHSFLSHDEFSRLCPAGTVKHEEMKFTLAQLTGEDCRLRWAELDASRWSVVAAEEGTGEDVASLPVALASSVPVYRVCVQPEVLGKGHGAQPSFQAMSSMIAGSMPAYLKVPVSFPSTSEFEEEEGEGDAADEANPDSLENLD
jgi:hypothetical protein